MQQLEPPAVLDLAAPGIGGEPQRVGASVPGRSYPCRPPAEQWGDPRESRTGAVDLDPPSGPALAAVPSGPITPPAAVAVDETSRLSAYDRPGWGPGSSRLSGARRNVGPCSTLRGLHVEEDDAVFRARCGGRRGDGVIRRHGALRAVPRRGDRRRADAAARGLEHRQRPRGCAAEARRVPPVRHPHRVLDRQRRDRHRHPARRRLLGRTGAGRSAGRVDPPRRRDLRPHRDRDRRRRADPLSRELRREERDAHGVRLRRRDRPQRQRTAPHVGSVLLDGPGSLPCRAPGQRAPTALRRPPGARCCGRPPGCAGCRGYPRGRRTRTSAPRWPSTGSRRSTAGPRWPGPRP